jgi:hypothetical protein
MINGKIYNSVIIYTGVFDCNVRPRPNFIYIWIIYKAQNSNNTLLSIVGTHGFSFRYTSIRVTERKPLGSDDAYFLRVSDLKRYTDNSKFIHALNRPRHCWLYSNLRFSRKHSPSSGSQTHYI